MSSPQAKEWLAAEAVELGNLQRNQTWEALKNMPTDTCGPVMPSKWVYTVKHKKDLITVDKFKARLVAGGHRRILGVDHLPQEVYCDVLMFATLRTALSIAVQDPACFIEHWDVKAAFITAKMRKTMYMRPPPGYSKDISVVKLLKALYGVPEAMRWFCDLFNDTVVGMGMKKSEADPRLYILRRGSSYCFLPVFVDDNYPVSNDPKLNKYQRNFHKIIRRL